MKRSGPFLFSLLLLAGALAVRADDSLIVTNETPTFVLDTRLPAGEPPGGSLIVQTESPPFTLDTRLPDGVATSSDTVVAESGPFTLDTRLLTDSTPPASLVVIAESPPFTLDTRLPSDTTPLPNLITQTESTPFTLDTRIPLQEPLYTNLIAMAESGPFTLDTLSGWFTAPAQILTGGSTGGKARFAPDGLRLSKTDGSRVLMWNLQSTRTNFVFTGHAAEVATVDFSPLGDQLLTGSADGTLRWWDTASRVELGRANPPGAGTVFAAYASDGACILAGRGTNATLYRVPAMQLMQEFTGSEGSISAVAVCPEGLAIVGNSSRSALLWDTATGAVRFHLTNHTRLITAAAFFPGGTNAMTASLDGTIRIWDTATGAETLRIQAGTQVGDAVLSLDGRIIASCDTANPGTAYLWDARSGALLRVFTDITSEASQIKGVALSPDQTALATTHVDGRVRLWDTGLEPHPIYPVTPLPIGTNAPVTLRSHGLYYFEVDAEAGRSLVLTLEADTGGGGGSKLKSLSAGTSGLSADAEFANLGGAASPNPRVKSLQTSPPGADITAFRMTATKGHLPSVYDYETFAQASVTNLHCEMPMAMTSTGKLYVLVFAPHLSAGSINAQIRAEYAPHHVSGIAPRSGGNRGDVTFVVLGTDFTKHTLFRLVRSGSPSITATQARLLDSTQVRGTFVLQAAEIGPYSLEVEWPETGATARIENAFTVEEARVLAPRVTVEIPAAVRPGRTYGGQITIANPSNLDTRRGFVVVGALASASLIFDVSKAGPLPASPVNLTTPGYSIIAVPPLAPGQEIQVRFQFTAPSAGNEMQIQASFVEAREPSGGSVRTLSGRSTSGVGPAFVGGQVKLGRTLDSEVTKYGEWPPPAGYLVFRQDDKSLTGHVGVSLGDGWILDAVPGGVRRIRAEDWTSGQELQSGWAESVQPPGYSEQMKTWFENYDGRYLGTPYWDGSDIADVKGERGHFNCPGLAERMFEDFGVDLHPVDTWKTTPAEYYFVVSGEFWRSGAGGDLQLLVYELHIGLPEVVLLIDGFVLGQTIGNTLIVHPIDPNDKLGPAGVGPNRVVSTNDFMDYMIRYENMAAASAPVQELIVVDYLDAGLDWTTVRFKEIAYGDRILTPPADSQSFTLRDIPPTNSTAITGAAVGHMVVDANVSLNPQIGRLEWKLSAIDTNTGLLPQDALSGFLPPENGTGRGQGYVRFSVKPKATTPIGTGITNTTSIVFDGNDPITTPPVWNIVGDVPSLATIIAYLPGQIMAGAPFSYTLAVTNNGSSAVTNVVLTNALPTGMNLVSNSVTFGTVTITNGVLTWNLGTVTNGIGATMTITIMPTQSGTFTNNVSFTGGSGLAIFQLPSVITVLVPPTLGIRLDDGQVALFWSTNYAGLHVQKTSSLSSSNQWVDLTNAPVLVSQEYRVTDGVPSGKQFYRLSNTATTAALQPELGIQVVGSQIQLFWPTNAAGFRLRSSSAVGSSAVWEDVANTPTSSGGFYSITISPSGASRYFRLVQP